MNLNKHPFADKVKGCDFPSAVQSLFGIRPLRVVELAEVLAVRPDHGEDSEYHSDWRPGDARQAVLWACSSVIATINVEGLPVVRFSHSSKTTD